MSVQGRTRAARPIIGITADASPQKFLVNRTYIDAVGLAGGVPVLLPCLAEHAAAYVRLCDGLLLTGGDDPITTRWGIPMHPKATPVDPARQEFELALLDVLQGEPSKPVLGICLGMQFMGLHAGGRLNQYLPDSLPTAADHWDRRSHEVHGALGRGIVHSHHRQALSEPGALQVVATAPDGVIEAVQAADRAFYLGVQWHPERTEDNSLGQGLIHRLVDGAMAS